MLCVTGCVCSCNQQGCGCRVTSARPTERPPTRPAKPFHPTATCGCGRKVIALTVRTPAGRTVVVIWCSQCDVPKGARR